MRRFAPTLFIFLLVSVTSPAQIAFEEEPLWVFDDPLEEHGRFWDVDGDGVMDWMVRRPATGIHQSGWLPGQSKDDLFGPLVLWPAWEINLDSIFLADTDHDGDLDVFVEGTSYVNSGIDHFHNEAGILSGPFWQAAVIGDPSGYALGDVDGDGHLDLFVTHYTNESPAGPMPDALYRGVPGGSFETGPPLWRPPADISVAPGFCDLDGDGDLDLFKIVRTFDGAFMDTLTVHLNRYEAGVTTVFEDVPDLILPEELGANQYELADVDGDGDFDLIANLFEGNALTLYINDGPPDFFRQPPVWRYSNSYAPVFRDFDGDGDLDLLHTSGIDSLLISFNVGGGSVFSTTPQVIIASEGINNIAPSDVDGDGDLDIRLLLGNTIPAELRENARPWQSISPDSLMVNESGTTALALADLSGDGLLDLVTGNNTGSQLFPNSEAGLLPFSTWSPQSQNNRAIKLGDINGDGLQDIVCGNWGQTNSLYLNQGGTFNSLPSWSSDSSVRTTSIALGDVDGDWDLDLVCGNTGTATSLYRNSGGIFQSYPVWLSPESSDSTRSVALGDVNGDGFCDLICGNVSGKNKIYLSDGSAFTDQPVWQTPGANDTWAVALGDVDGDGDLDLICGNDGSKSMLFYNQGDEFLSVPWKTEAAEPTRALLLEDLDGDGDLDLLLGSGDGTLVLYTNRGGDFGDQPTHRIVTGRNLTSLALGDIDNDGDSELIVGSHGLKNLSYHGQRNPIYRHDPVSPTHHTPENPGYLREVRAQNPDTNLWRITFTTVDIEADQVWVRAQYRFRDLMGWLPVGDGELMGPFAAPPAGMSHSFDWDVSMLPVDLRPVQLRLQAVSPPQRVVMGAGSTMDIPFWEVSLGPLGIRRAVLAAPSGLDLPGVTVGDTVETVVQLANHGNLDLHVTDITLPTGEMWIGSSTPFTITPGETTSVILNHGPRIEVGPVGDLQIVCDDPERPIASIPLRTRIRELSAWVRAMYQGDTALLGEALTIAATPPDTVEVETFTLYYRAGESQGPFTQVPMSGNPGDPVVSGVIVGEDVTESGLEFYVLLENSGVTATEPPRAPDDSLFTVPVTAPAGIVSNPIASSSSGFLVGRSVRVEIDLPSGTVFQSGALYYRPGGRGAFDSLDIHPDGASYTATIPDTTVGPRGVEYWVEVQTSTSTLSDPPTDPAGSPHAIRVRVTDLVEPVIHAGFQYRMVSVPLDFGGDFTGTLESLLSDQTAFGPYPAEPYELGQWRCFRSFPPEGNHVELPSGLPGDFRVEPGRGFWLISRDENWIATSPVAGTSTPTADAFEITLAPGWNMVGHPFFFPVAWNSVLVDGQPPGAAVVEGPWAYDGTPYNEAMLLEPFAGYWLRNNTDPAQDLTLSIPPQASPEGMVELKSDDEGSQADVLWHLTLMAECAGVLDGTNRLGVIACASNTWDRYDRHEPPPAPERSLSLYFPHRSWQVQQGNYTMDYRSQPLSTEEGLCWRFDVAKNFAVEGVGDEVVLTVDGIESLPAETMAVLVDNHLGSSTDLLQSNNHRYFCGHRDFIQSDAVARFQLLVGSEEYVSSQIQDGLGLPSRMALLQNRPNPFNPATVIRYDIARPGQVHLRVYDLSGALVKTVLNEFHDIGRYEIVWRGDDDNGRQVSSGVYFYRLESSDFVDTKRMTLVR